MSPAGQRDGYRYPALAGQLEIGPRTGRNRIVQAPLSVSCLDQDGRSG
jgi:hypothetical protein